MGIATKSAASVGIDGGEVVADDQRASDDC